MAARSLLAPTDNNQEKCGVQGLAQGHTNTWAGMAGIKAAIYQIRCQPLFLCITAAVPKHHNEQKKKKIIWERIEYRFKDDLVGLPSVVTQIKRLKTSGKAVLRGLVCNPK